jgi:uncharacterized damage-inducible protein DinB
MTRLQLLLEQLEFTRKYTIRLIETIDYSDWFRVPQEGITHVAWEVGHLAMADYRLCIDRIRGAKPEDETLISSTFLKQFGRESVANPDPSQNPSPQEIRAILDRVHEAAITEVSKLTETDLDTEILKPHSLCKTKWEIIRWCSHHEMVHTGQIGLLRRLFGAKYIW